jgi:PAS domain S-box-containing protein
MRFRLAAIVDSSDDAMISSTLEGSITSWNRAAQEIFGYTEEQVLGTPMSCLMPGGRETEIEELLARIRRGKRVEPHDAVRRCRDGREIDVSISMSAIFGRDGALVGASKVIRDITLRKQAEAALARAKEAAETSSEAFEAFSYSVAHDLRAPLRAIDGFSQALTDEYAPILDLTGLDYLERVRTAAQQMAELIDSLLALAQVTHRELASNQVDLSGLATTALNRLQQAAPQRAVDAIVQPGLTACGDPTLLANVLENLLGNAWKFTRNQPRALIEFGRDQAGYFVRDNGAGFDMAFSAKLFGVFQRLHSPQEFQGTGIGLATVQRIIRRHGGQVQAEGTVGYGATFHFTLAEETS